MPANLPPQYYELEREYKAEKDPREKLRLAQELLAMMPKHKGTDKLQADLKSKIAKLKKQFQSTAKSHGTRHAPTHDHIDREGAGQIILIGPPNSGKSSLVDVLTNAEPLVADYPYTTREPLAGMMPFETIQLQLIDTPPVSDELYEPYLPNLVRQADLVLLVTDLSDDNIVARAQYVVDRLADKRVHLRPSCDETIDDVAAMVKKTIICAHKEYDDPDGKRLEALRQAFADFRILPTSILDDDALARLKQVLFKELNIIRVFTKQIGKEPVLEDPIILPEGGTVADAAASIHKDFAAKLKYARVWGEGKFDGQRVTHEYALSDGDIIEFHI